MKFPISGLLIFAGLASAAAQSWLPGREANVTIPNLESPVLVRVPDNYAADRKWPIVFHYHTKGMQPNVLLAQTYTEGRDFVLVAMPREREDVFLAGEPFWREQFQRLRDVRAHLAGRGLKIDESRTYLGGIGMGGWYASYFADLAMNELAGVYIVAAGTFGASKLKAARIRDRRPIYIGVGQLESNFGYALNAKGHFQRLGAHVSFDEYTGQDHMFPVPPVGEISERLRQWWQVEANRATPEKGRELVGYWQELIERHLAGLKKPMDRYLLVEHLPSFPFFRALPAEFRAKLQAQLGSLTAAPALKEEMAARRAYLALNHEEILDFDVRNRRRIAHNYASLYQKFPTTHYGMRAGVAAIRLRDLVENPDRWQFRTDEEREKFIATIERRPLPTLPEAKFLEEMNRVVNQVYLN